MDRYVSEFGIFIQQGRNLLPNSTNANSRFRHATRRFQCVQKGQVLDSQQFLFHYYTHYSFSLANLCQLAQVARPRNCFTWERPSSNLVFQRGKDLNNESQDHSEYTTGSHGQIRLRENDPRHQREVARQIFGVYSLVHFSVSATLQLLQLCTYIASQACRLPAP